MQLLLFIVLTPGLSSSDGYGKLLTIERLGRDIHCGACLRHINSHGCIIIYVHIILSARSNHQSCLFMFLLNVYFFFFNCPSAVGGDVF